MDSTTASKKILIETIKREMINPQIRSLNGTISILEVVFDELNKLNMAVEELQTQITVITSQWKK